MNELLRIVELARRGGVSRKAIRYCERLGLLFRPRRSPSRYRPYTEADVGRLLFNKQPKGVGLPLARSRDRRKPMMRGTKGPLSGIGSVILAFAPNAS